MNPSNLKHKVSKNGTIAVSCKGSHHLAWYKERKEEDIQKCLDHFCRDCPILECERNGKSKNRGLEAFLKRREQKLMVKGKRHPLTLHLVLKGEYFDAIDEGRKTVEYRDNTPYWRKRIAEKWDSNGGNIVVFHKGYTKIVMMFHIKLLVLGEQIELHLGDRILSAFDVKRSENA